MLTLKVRIDSRTRNGNQRTDKRQTHSRDTCEASRTTATHKAHEEGFGLIISRMSERNPRCIQCLMQSIQETIPQLACSLLHRYPRTLLQSFDINTGLMKRKSQPCSLLLYK